MNLVPHTDPVLRQVSTPFDFQNPPMDPEELSRGLLEAMGRHKGLGISAVQVGIPLRAFAVRTDPEMVVFNPILVDTSTETVKLEEGCLSVPGVFMKVERPHLIRARFQIKTGETFTVKYSGMTARIFQHELDHLDGKLFFDGVSRLKMSMALTKAAKKGHRYKLAELIP